MDTNSHYKPAGASLLHWAPAIAVALLSLAAGGLQPRFAPEPRGDAWGFFLQTLASQFEHLNAAHWLLNMAGLLIVNWGLASSLPWRVWALAWVWSWLGVSAYVTWVEPMQWMCGLSGLLHGVFTLALVNLLVQKQVTRPFSRSWPLWALLAGFLVKLGLEATTDPHWDPLLNNAVAVAAHRGGVLSGLILALAWRFWLSNRRA